MQSHSVGILKASLSKGPQEAGSNSRKHEPWSRHRVIEDVRIVSGLRRRLAKLRFPSQSVEPLSRRSKVDFQNPAVNEVPWLERIRVPPL